ncbi:hypothetical protein N181_26380 [Sinorhizobium fredii USDA 205]|nr:hypothetical protein AB395_00002075 [Sinorhizobium fredii CCBAU 45436]AWM25566.1 Ferric hydroxamate ABC transporter permease component FhuB [Sinorhizobium fredii CCBAU 25509]KSV83091.1 hypothetical protein N181_26380 [Sinorhizobium fredii USDA 205]
MLAGLAAIGVGTGSRPAVAVPTAVAVLVIGPLSFVGLMAPHLAALTGFRRPVLQIFAAAIYGALMLTIADWAGRTIIFPWQVPAGLLTALVGGPFFLFMMARAPRSSERV